MYGFPLWKYLPLFLSSSIGGVIKHKDDLYNLIGKVVQEAKEEQMTGTSILSQVRK